MSELLKVQNIEAVKGTKVHGYLKIMDRPSGKHKIPITLINGKGDGPTMYSARLVFPGDTLYTLLKVDEPTGW